MVSGGDFTSVRTTPGLAFGTQTGTRTAPAKHDDSTALLTGSWGADQLVQIVVHYTGAPADSDCDEVEIRLRSALSAKPNTGYEINCCAGQPTMKGYIQTGKINGATGDFPGQRDHPGATDILQTCQRWPQKAVARVPPDGPGYLSSASLRNSV